MRLLSTLWRPGASRVVLLLGPSGYGKTILMAQAAENAELCVPLNLLEVEGDAHALVEAMAEALSDRFPEVAHEIHTGNGERTLPARQTARLLGHLPPALILVDHAERLCADSETWLLELVRALPQQHRMIIAGRTLDSFEVPYLVATQHVRVIGPEQLAFDNHELHLLASEAPHAPNSAALQHLHGWPLGVALAITGAYGQTAAELIRVLLRTLPRDLQRVLPHLAPYDTWTDSLPPSLGLEVPDNWLGTLLMARWPLLQNGQGGFNPHEVILGVLEEQLRRDTQEWQRAYRQAAERALAGDRPLHAFGLLLNADLVSEAAHLAERVVPTLMSRGQFLVMRQVLDRLPKEVTTGSPVLTRHYGIALIETEQLQAGMGYLQALAEAPGTRVQVLPALAHGMCLQARLLDAKALIEEAKGYLGQYGVEEQLELLSTEGNILRDIGHPREGLELLLKAARLAETNNAEKALGTAMIGLNASYLRLSKLDEAMNAVKKAHLIFERLGMVGRLPIPLLNAALLHAAKDELTPARDLLHRALNMAEEQQARSLTSVYFALGGICLKEGKTEEATGHLMKAVEHARVSGRPDRQYMAELILSEALRAQFQHVEADRHLGLAESLLELHPQIEENATLAGLIQFQQGQRAYAQGRGAEAASHFRAVPTETGEISEWAARAGLYRALIAHEQGTLGEEHIRAFMELHRQQQSRRYLYPDLAVTRPVLREAVRQGWFVPELQEFAFGQLQDQRHRLYIKTLGALTVTLNDEPLQLVGSNVTRAQELIALMALVPPATAGELQRILIGEKKGDHRNALSTLRQSLVRATGLPHPVVQDASRRYKYSDELDVRTDIDELRRAVRTRNILALRKLLGQGTEFLPGIDSAWAADLRETEIPEVLSDAYEVLGTEALERRAFTEALRYYEAVQHLNPAEHILRALIEIHRALGDTAKMQNTERELQVLFPN
ncbi:ATP-binding protein [Deinococcus budaensis]|uniref:Tetratricopeptide (TPR) repeat protein n=1 Tax=Deinococcus budaensis TaxID=1665626 RepID=A0A7W8LPV8_9DEIO|nr:hypothetical protein [Deinococcus budaensis]MBB5234183.1 tetratricopeptide (TPR) repeat protein [Deinococcus budaensis]